MPGEVNDRIKNVLSGFEAENGNIKEFNTKQIVVLLHKETQQRIKDVENKIDEHIQWGQNEDRRLTKYLSDHDMLLERIMNTLPEKGFCERVENALEINQSTGKSELKEKVSTLWHDRRWIKGLIVVLITLSGLTVYDILMRILP